MEGFSVSSQYKRLCVHETEDNNKRIWKAKIPLKSKVFMWLTKQGAILTKGDLLKRKWQGDKSCSFCSDDETIGHLFCLLVRWLIMCGV